VKAGARSTSAVHRAETSKAVYRDVEVVRASNRELIARICRVPEPAIRTALKAATPDGRLYLACSGVNKVAVVKVGG
jgi:hypothetical protein